MAAPSLTYTLTNGTTADASQVMENFNNLLNGITDGTKDLSISALTCAGTATLNGHVNLGNSSADDITVTGSLASTLPIKTTNSYDIGSSSLGLRALYFGANSQTVNIKGSSSMSATWTMTLPTTAGTANYLLQTNGSGVTSWETFTDWTDIAYSSGLFTASGTMTWTVDSGDISAHAYKIVGDSLHLVLVADTTTIGGSASSQLRLTLPNGATVAKTTAGTFAGVNGGGTNLPAGVWLATAGLTYVQFKINIGSSFWTTGTNNCSVHASMVIPI